MDGGESGEFSDELDEFEESVDETKQKNLRNQTSYTNKPYDEAYEVSQDLSMAESFDGRADHKVAVHFSQLNMIFLIYTYVTSSL